MVDSQIGKTYQTDEGHMKVSRKGGGREGGDTEEGSLEYVTWQLG